MDRVEAEGTWKAIRGPGNEFLPLNQRVFQLSQPRSNKWRDRSTQWISQPGRKPLNNLPGLVQSLCPGWERIRIGKEWAQECI
jgi:hypothetical protein